MFLAGKMLLAQLAGMLYFISVFLGFGSSAKQPYGGSPEEQENSGPRTGSQKHLVLKR